MYLLRWLREEGLPFDLITDFDLHEQGAALLSRYAVVVTGAHPEYMTREMLDSFRSYRDEGGNIMYLGGNGFYHATGIVSRQPLVTEIRRGNSGIRGWESDPGEATLTSTGEPSGLWRHRGRAPQKLVGVGMAAQGWDRSSPYRRTPASHDEAVSWIFDGVEREQIGTVGAVRGGAAGDEIDRADVALGTPPGTVVLATSYGHSDAYQRAIEEVGMNLPGMGGGSSDPEVHADVTYTRFPRGGAVFSVGSIAWTGSLAPEARDPGVVAVTRNDLRRFAGLS
jgi:N,N-dimethylformamidase